MKIRLSSAALLLALGLSSMPAFAEPTDFDRTTARTLGKEGHEALDKQDWATAADRFARADSLVHAPTFVLGLAQARAGLGKLVSALELYNRILREPLASNAPAPFVDAVESARTEFAALAPRIPYVILKTPDGADLHVTIDGIEVPKAALGVRRAVDPGKHVVRAEGAGVAAFEVSVTSVEGKTETVSLEPKPQTAPRPPVVPARDSGPPPAPPPAGSSRRTLGFVGLVVGGAGLGLGAALGGVVISKHGDLLASCPEGHCPLNRQAELQPQLDSYHLFSALSTASFVVGGVLAGAGGVVLLTAPTRAKPAVGAVAPGFTLTPMIGLGFAGARGSF
jgi:hypothetical protein